MKPRRTPFSTAAPSGSAMRSCFVPDTPRRTWSCASSPTRTAGRWPTPRPSAQLNLYTNHCSDTYEDSLKTDEPLVAHNCRNGSCEHRAHQHQHQHQHPHYQNTKFEKRSSCVRHSFSGVKDDLMQHSPQISLRPRGHALRNSMNDLEQRLHNLEQSFRRPLEFSKSNSLF